jgi:prepilin-type N-terminal cleavage/methylation domain-containing protein
MHSYQRAFSLVELSIVLVIVGLLTGGILMGQSLIRNSELQSIVSEVQKYKDAAIAFREQYDALPGDMSDATNYWGRQINVASCVTNSAAAVATPGACDGDGDGLVEWAGAVSTSGEAFQFWRQLSQSKIITGQFTGLAGSGATTHVVVGTNAPASKLTNAGWGAFTFGNYVGDASNFAYNYGSVLTLGGTVSNNWNFMPIMKPEEAWNIDTKVDDGKPGAGNVITFNITSCANAANSADYAADYRVNSTSTVCGLYFANAF